MKWYMHIDKNNIPNGWVNDNPQEGYIEVSQEVRVSHEKHPDWIWNGTELIKKVEIVSEATPYIPSSISMLQARLILLNKGYLETVNQAISGMGEAEEIEWEYATEVLRDSKLVAGIKQILGLTEEQVDNIFKEAVTL